MKIKVGIVGGAGYTAGELIRILVNHPQAELVFVNSSSHAGSPVAGVHAGLTGECDLVFTDLLPLDSIDVLFLCTAHGDSSKFFAAQGMADSEGNITLPKGLKVIDLAQDYRDESQGFVYGLPEINRGRIAATSRLANPGCFATCLQLAILPLAAKGLLTDDVNVTAITGSTGAGVKPSATSHFSWRNDNISVYKAFTHQHLLEIGRNVRRLQPSFQGQINFVPMRGDFARGIFASVFTKCALSEEEARSLYEDFYRDAAFTHVCADNIDMKQAVNTNKALVHVEKHGEQLLVLSTIDNLLKGASGQAVQNMNLMFGLNEKTGLNLKNIGF